MLHQGGDAIISCRRFWSLLCLKCSNECCNDTISTQHNQRTMVDEKSVCVNYLKVLCFLLILTYRSPHRRVHVSSVLCYDSLGHIRLILSISFLRLYCLSFPFSCSTNCQVSLLTWWLVCRRLSPGEMTIQLEWQKEHKWPKETSSDFVSLSMDGLNGDRRQIGRVFVSLEVFWPLIRLEISDDLFSSYLFVVFSFPMSHRLMYLLVVESSSCSVLASLGHIRHLFYVRVTLRLLKYYYTG